MVDDYRNRQAGRLRAPNESPLHAGGLFPAGTGLEPLHVRHGADENRSGEIREPRPQHGPLGE